MRPATCSCLIAILAGCGPQVEAPLPPADAASIVAAPKAAEVATAVAPHISRKPDLQPGNILSEKMNWSRVDMSVKLSVVIDQSGAVVTTSLASVSPVDSELAAEVGQFVAERFKTAMFEAPSEFSYPYSFDVTVNLPAPRDASGRLK